MFINKKNNIVYLKTIKETTHKIKKIPLFALFCTEGVFGEIFSILYRFPHNLLIFENQDMDTRLSESYRTIQIRYLDESQPYHSLRQVLDNGQNCPLPHTTYRFGFLFRYLENINIWAANKLKEELTEYLSSEYYMSEICPYDDSNGIPFYKPKNTNMKSLLIRLVIAQGGYGDTIKALPVIKEFIEKKSKEGFEVVIEYINEKPAKILKCFFPSIRIIRYPFAAGPKEFADLLRRQFDMVLPYREEYNINYLAAFRTFKLNDPVQQMQDLLHVELKEDFHIMPAIVHEPELFNDIKTLMDNRIHYRAIVGCQFFTSGSNKDPNDLIENRSWSEDYVKQFVRLCRAQDILVVNLAPTGNYNFTEMIDFSKYSISSLFHLVQKLDCLVGIDSCFSHIAGVLKIPHIILYPNNKDVLHSLCMDYNMISPHESILDIYPDEVFLRLKQILNKEIILESRPFLNESHVEWINPKEK